MMGRLQTEIQTPPEDEVAGALPLEWVVETGAAVAVALTGMPGDFLAFLLLTISHPSVATAASVVIGS
jgi:hypothetical protein